jgi:Tfp pilus assembly protein PilN
MRRSTNLARKPFRNRRLFWLAIILIFTIPSYLGFGAVRKITSLKSQISQRSEKVKDLEGRLENLAKSAESNNKIPSKISPEQNRKLLAANALIDRHAFSWSQLLNDIERNLPGSVRIVKVAVTQIQSRERDGTIGGNQIAAASLALDVIGKSDQDVTAMISKFENSGRFKVYPQNKSVLEGLSDVEYSLRVDYFPPPVATNTSLKNQVAERKP